jgi:phage shock protein A
MVKLITKISGKEYKFETTEALVKQLKDDSAKTSKELESIETTYKKLKKKKNTMEATIRQLTTVEKPKG